MNGALQFLTRQGTLERVRVPGQRRYYFGLRPGTMEVLVARRLAVMGEVRDLAERGVREFGDRPAGPGPVPGGRRTSTPGWMPRLTALLERFRAEQPARQGRPAMIDLAGVGKTFGEGAGRVRALDGVDLHVAAGRVRRGAGAVRQRQDHAAQPHRGTGHGQRRVHPGGRGGHLRAGRRELFEFRRRTVSFVFQSFNIFPGLTAAENVQFGIDVAGRAGTDAAEVLASVGLAGRGDSFPHQLSGGEQQRVAIARALATGNPVLLADEPTGELDFRTGVQILGLLESRAAEGRAVLVVTHNREISRAADRVVELSGGRIVSDGPPAGGRARTADLHW